VLTREPGGTEVGERIRELQFDKGAMSGWAEGTLFAASRAEHVDRLDELREAATRDRLLAAECACEIVRASWREGEELQLSMPLALEALLMGLPSEFGAAVPA
jgi:thymidylate kinase